MSTRASAIIKLVYGQVVDGNSVVLLVGHVLCVAREQDLSSIRLFDPEKTLSGLLAFGRSIIQLVVLKLALGVEGCRVGDACLHGSDC